MGIFLWIALGKADQNDPAEISAGSRYQRELLASALGQFLGHLGQGLLVDVVN